MSGKRQVEETRKGKVLGLVLRFLPNTTPVDPLLLVFSFAGREFILKPILLRLTSTFNQLLPPKANQGVTHGCITHLETLPLLLLLTLYPRPKCSLPKVPTAVGPTASFSMPSLQNLSRLRPNKPLPRKTSYQPSWKLAVPAQILFKPSDSHWKEKKGEMLLFGQNSQCVRGC